MITLNLNGESVDFANVAEVFNKDGKDTTREFRNKLFGSWLTDEFDSAIKLAESIKARRTLLEGYINNLNILEKALSSEVTEEQLKLCKANIVNMTDAQLDALALAIAQQKAKTNS